MPLVKIKQEDTSMDEEETTTPQPSWKEKYKHLLKTFEVKVEPLENLKAKAGRYEESPDLYTGCTKISIAHF